MKLTNENALIGSLLGSKAIGQLPRFEKVQNHIGKHVLPPINFLPFRKQPDKLANPDDFGEFEIWENDRKKSEFSQFFPFSFKSSTDEDWYLLPWEPLISIDANVRIAERYIAKAGKSQIGSIKERWSMDDYNITITGAFYGEKTRGWLAETYPREDMERLRDYLLTPEALEVKCEPLQILNINKIAITSVSFPFTKGENVQAYEIKAKSDFPYDLIYKKKKKHKIIVDDYKREFIW